MFWDSGNLSMVFWCACRHITPYIRKYGKHPVAGTTLKLEDLIPLTFHKNAEGLDFYFYFFLQLFLLFIIIS